MYVMLLMANNFSFLVVFTPFMLFSDVNKYFFFHFLDFLVLLRPSITCESTMFMHIRAAFSESAIKIVPF